MKRVDLAVFRNIVAALDSSFKGGVYTLEAANDGITYAPFHDAAIPKDVATKIEDDPQGSGRRLDRHRSRPGHRPPELSTDDHVEARARAPKARGPVFAWQGLTQP